MSTPNRLHAHLAQHVVRRTAFLTFAGSAAVLLAALLIGSAVLVALVFFYGFGTDAFFSRVSPHALALLRQTGLALAAVGILSLLSFILGCCMMVASINHARYRTAYLWFVSLTALLAVLVALRVSTY